MEQKISPEELKRAWPPDQADLFLVFDELRTFVLNQPEVETAIFTRPGISHSFRAAPAEPPPGRSRPVFFLVDVVISDVDPWFLSVCFYEDEITDPRDLGNPIPRGLYDETGYCFDVEAAEPALTRYLKKRIDEAYRHVGGPLPD